MATIKVIQCDSCGLRVERDEDVAILTIESSGNVFKADLCPTCTTSLPLENFAVSRKRGRKPKQAVEA